MKCCRTFYSPLSLSLSLCICVSLSITVQWAFVTFVIFIKLTLKISEKVQMFLSPEALLAKRFDEETCYQSVHEDVVNNADSVCIKIHNTWNETSSW